MPSMEKMQKMQKALEDIYEGLNYCGCVKDAACRCVKCLAAHALGIETKFDKPDSVDDDFDIDYP